MRRTARVLTAGLLVTLPAAGCREVRDTAVNDFSPATPGKLVVAAEVPDPGFWEGTPDDVTGGFEFALATALADDFDLQLEVVEVPFGDVVGGRLGRADLALQEVSVTLARREVVEFSVPYFSTSPTVLARHDGGDAAQLTDLATAQEQRWAVRADTTEEQYLQEVVRPDEAPTVLRDADAVVAAVVDGTVDAALVDLAAALIAAAGSDVLVAAARFDHPEDVAAVLPSGSDNVTAVDQVIRRLQADGTIRTLVETWLDPRYATAPDELPVILAG